MLQNRKHLFFPHLSVGKLKYLIGIRISLIDLAVIEHGDPIIALEQFTGKQDHFPVITVPYIAPFCMDRKFFKHEKVHQGKEMITAGAFEPESVFQHPLFQLIIEAVSPVESMADKLFVIQSLAVGLSWIVIGNVPVDLIIGIIFCVGQNHLFCPLPVPSVTCEHIQQAQIIGTGIIESIEPSPPGSLISLSAGLFVTMGHRYDFGLSMSNSRRTEQPVCHGLGAGASVPEICYLFFCKLNHLESPFPKSPVI